MATTHVILKEAHHEKQTPYFLDYCKQYTDSPYFVKLEADGNNYTPGRMIRANELEQFKDIENGDWKFLNIDSASGEFVIPKGSMGHRWDKDKNRQLEYEAGKCG